MFKVLISDAMSGVAEQILKDKGIEVDVITDLSEEEIVKIIPNYQGLIVRSATKVTKNILNAATNLKAIARAGAGVDNIDCVAAREKNIVVMNTPGGNTNATAELALSLIMSSLRKIPFADKTTHNGEWQKKAIKGTELYKKTVGIVGFGNVSKRLCKLLQGFDVELLVCSQFYDPNALKGMNIRQAEFEEVVAKSDIVSFHCKATADGKPLLTKKHFSNMKKSALVVNTARGNIVDENDLNEALNEGLIAAAAIDVFSVEPAKENVLFNNPKVVLTPHLGASTAEASIVVAEMAAQQVANLLQNNKEVYVVN